MKINRFEVTGIKCIEVAPENPDADLALVIGLHGRGDWGESYLDIAPMISETAYRYIFPTAPLALPGALFEWFRFDNGNLGQETAKARQILFKLLANLAERYKTPASRTFLWGFSQGSMMTLDAGLRYRDGQGQRLAGLGALSGFLVADSPFSQSNFMIPGRYFNQDQGDLKEVVAEAVADQIPVFMGHGTYDPVVPVQAGRVSRDYLQAAGLKLEYYEFAGAHQLILPEIEALRDFIAKSLSKA